MATIQIDDEKLYREITEYCRANGKKIGAFCTELLRREFLIEKYGDTPFGRPVEHKQIETTAVPEEKAVTVPEPVAKIEEINDKTEKEAVNAVEIKEEPKEIERKVRPRRRVL